MSQYRDALLSVTLINDEGQSQDLMTHGSIFEVMHVCQAFGLVPDEEVGEGGVIFVHSNTGSFGSVRPVDSARNVIEALMSGDCGHDHSHD